MLNYKGIIANYSGLGVNGMAFVFLRELKFDETVRKEKMVCISERQLTNETNRTQKTVRLTTIYGKKNTKLTIFQFKDMLLFI